MKEVTFLDRVPTYPGRVTLTPVAGQANTYDMARADAPRVEGTPLDKATFESLAHSRLTGRYYETALTREVYVARTGLTTSPIPTSGWVENAETSHKATNGLYAVEVSSDQAAYGFGYEAFSSSGWESGGGTESWIQIYHAQAIKVRAMSFNVDLQYPSRLSVMAIIGSNDLETWVNLYSTSVVTENSNVTYNLTTVGEYTYYRLYFISSDSNRITVKNWKYTLYDVNAYTNAFTVADNFPTSWTEGQRVMIATPQTVNSFSVVANTLNGVSVGTILQPNKRYELRYSGASFVAKEV